MATEKTETKKPLISVNVHGVSVAIWPNVNAAGVKYNSISCNISGKKNPDGSYGKNRTIQFPSDIENIIEAYTQVKVLADAEGIQTGFVERK